MSGGELFELVTVPGGAVSLRSREHGETFHPGIGPMEEARILHVEQHRFAERARVGEPFVIWDVGLGAAANALAVIQFITSLGGAAPPVELRSFDKSLDPLRFALSHADRLEYPARWVDELQTLISGGMVQIGPIRWIAELGDFRRRVAECSGPAPRAVIFDPYSPAANPEMWTAGVFAAIRSRAADDCTFSTYSRSTATRVDLLQAGWYVGHGAATGEKTETTIAATRLELLSAPLPRAWLQRVRRSTAPALFRGGSTPVQIAAALERHPQMQPVPSGNRTHI